MKKLILSMAALAGFAIVACSSDDDSGSEYNNCVMCNVTGQSNVEVCEGDNGNAYYSDVDSGVAFDDYIAALDCN